MNEENLKCLSDRLNYALEHSGTSKAELARLIGVQPQTIQYLCSTKAESSKFTFEIAHVLAVNFEWLAVGKGEMSQQQKVPKVSDSAPVTSLPLTYVAEDLKGFVHSGFNDFKRKNPLFGVQLQDESMWPRFSKGTLLIFSSAANQNSSGFVLVYLQAMDAILFRELIEQDTKKLLIPFNSGLFKEIELNAADQILGVLIEARWRAEQ